MRRSQSWLGGSRRIAVALVGTIALSCSPDMTAPPAPGTVRITAPTTGLDAPERYSIFVDQVLSRTVSPEGTLDVSLLTPGEHQVRIEVAANCTVQDEATRTVTVTSMTTTPVSFNVQCVAAWGVVDFTLSTTGPDRPYNYLLKASSSNPVSVFSNMVGSLTNLAPGEQVITLQNVPSNCFAADNPRTVQITAGTLVRDTVDVAFNVACTALTGVVAVSVTTGGDDRDLSGYMLSVDGGQTLKNVSATSTTNFGGLSGGQHTVAVSDLATNCTVTGSNSRAAQVTVGGATQDTAHVAFEIVCTRVSKFGFTRFDESYTPRLVVVNADGSSEYVINVEGFLGSWSNDGRVVIMQAVDCDGWYGYYYGCNQLGVQTVQMDALPDLSLAMLTRTWEDNSPVFSPDGKKIAFVRRDRLFVMNADGTEPTAIVTPGEASNVKIVRAPAWSPDGKRIAFACDLWQVSWSDICAVDVDGNNLTRITTDAYADASPAWSPDGSRIAFSTNRNTSDGKMHVATMSAAGANFAQLTPGVMPAWSGDGTRILFSVEGSTPGIFIMNSDGTHLARLTFGNDHGPKWRP